MRETWGKVHQKKQKIKVSLELTDTNIYIKWIKRAYCISERIIFNILKHNGKKYETIYV